MKKTRLRNNADQRLRRQKFYNILGGALLIVVIASLVLLAWKGTTQRVDTSDYDGVIVDRWADYSESQQGSRPYFRLLVEDANGKQFRVRVEPSVYESARVGMRIKSRSGQVVLIDSGQRSTGGK